MICIASQDKYCGMYHECIIMSSATDCIASLYMYEVFDLLKRSSDITCTLGAITFKIPLNTEIPQK